MEHESFEDEEAADSEPEEMVGALESEQDDDGGGTDEEDDDDEIEEDATRLATMAKLKAGRLSREVADRCLQFWGGMGYVLESPISRIFRDGRLTSIGGGADEVMMQILCKFMGTFPQSK